MISVWALLLELIDYKWKKFEEWEGAGAP